MASGSFLGAVFGAGLALLTGTDAAGTRAQSISNMLSGFAATHCSVESVVEFSGLYRTAQLVTAKTWLRRTLRSKRVRIVWRRKDKIYSKGKFVYAERGHPYYVWWDDFLSPGIPERRRLTIRACIFFPERIEILDRSPDRRRRSVRVLYVSELGYSWAGRQLLALGLLAGNNTFPELNAVEHSAWLKQNRAGVWKIEHVE